MLFRSTVLFNSGRRFGNTLRNEEAGSSIGKGTPQGEKGPSSVVSDNETDFDEEQYPPAEDRYKQLEDRLNAMEIQQVPGLDFGDLGFAFCVRKWFGLARVATDFLFYPKERTKAQKNSFLRCFSGSGGRL